MDSGSQRVVRMVLLIGFAIAGVFGTLPLGARADDAGPGVARVSLIKGGVNIRRADSGDTISAAINAPLSVGDYLFTQNDARTEVQLGARTSLRAGANTQLRFTNLDASSSMLQLAAGTVELRLFGANDEHPEVDTPSVAIRPAQKGRYRVSVDADGNTLVTVRSGAADIVAQNATQTLRPGTSVEISGDGSSAQIQTVTETGHDGFDAWNDERDRYEGIGASYAYVDPAIVGADDLGRYGSWVDEPDYGEVWRPSYAAGWAPYHDGQWVWESYYGWTWVSAEPWGWAPYHYGRWFYAADEGWCWYPRPVAYEAPVYRPALVAFFSFGGLNFGFGNVGWVPLAPYEAFNPWWGNGYGFGSTVFNHVTNITTVNNITNVTNITNINNYRNISAPGGAVAINTGDFKGGRFAHLITVTPKQVRMAKLVERVLPIVPSRQNLAYASHPSASLHSDLNAARFASFPPIVPRFPIRTFAEQQAAVTAAVHRFERPTASIDTAPHDTARRAPSPNGAARARVISPSPWDRFAQKLTQPKRRDSTRRGATTVTRDTIVAPAHGNPWDRFERVTPPPSNAGAALVHAPANRTRAASSSDPFARFDTHSLPRPDGSSEHRARMPSPYGTRPSSYGGRPPYDPNARSDRGRPGGSPVSSRVQHDATYGSGSPRVQSEYERQSSAAPQTSPTATAPHQSHPLP